MDRNDAAQVGNAPDAHRGTDVADSAVGSSEGKYPSVWDANGVVTSLAWIGAESADSTMAHLPEKEFFASVLNLMKGVSSCTEALAREIMRHSRGTRGWMLPRSDSRGGIMKGIRQQLRDRSGGPFQAHQEILAKIAFFESFCEINGRSLAQLMGLHDKREGGEAGAWFIDACQRSAIKYAKFVQSPEIIEVRSIRSLHQDQLLELQGEAQPHVRGEYGELCCPICLDLVHKPVGLGCGHVMCNKCALETGGCRPSDKLSAVPAACPCPMCRRPGVWSTATPLPETARLAKKRFPTSAKRRSQEKRPESLLDVELTLMSRRGDPDIRNALRGEAPAASGGEGKGVLVRIGAVVAANMSGA